MATPISDTTFKQALAAVKAENNGASWVGHCPAHGDNRKSLAIWQDKEKALGVKGLFKEESSSKGGTKIKAAQLLWDSGVPIEGTPAEVYLKSRGIDKIPPGSGAYWFEKGSTKTEDVHALINPIYDWQGRLQGVQRLYITASGAKAKVDPSRRINGLRKGGGVMLPGTDPLVLAEGYETGLSIWLATGYQVVCTLGLANLDKFPLGSGMSCVVARDRDPPNSKADKYLWRAVRSLRQRDIKVKVALPDEYDGMKKTDFNDVHQKADLAKVKELIDAAAELDEADPLSKWHQDLLDPIEAVKTLNSKYLVVKDAGKTVIFEEKHDVVLNREMRVRMSFTDFRNFHMNRSVNSGAGAQPKQLGEWWLESPQRRQYEHVVFSPTGADERDYNLWRGWAYEPEPGDWSRLREHIFDVVCKQQDELYGYLIGWMARQVQFLDSPGQVAVVLRGKRGAGKGTLVNAYGNLFGQHYLQVSQAKHVTGNFNSHLRDCLVLFADEAFWAGDKQGESVLKTLITESTLPIEGKGKDVVQEKNRVKLLVASNNAWVVPAGMEERRFAVYDVPDTHMQDTSALLEQKLSSMQPHEKWWYECLLDGEIVQHKPWDNVITATDLHGAYIEWARKINLNRLMSQTDLIRIIGGMIRGNWTRKRLSKSADNTRPWGYTLPSLEDCRNRMDELLRQPSDWEHAAHPSETEAEAEDTTDLIPF